MLNLMDMLRMTEIKGIESPFDYFKEAMSVLDDRIDRDTLAGIIIKECGALPCMYETLQPFWFNHKLWFRVNKDVINHLCETMYYDYDPLKNYDMLEDTKKDGTMHTEGAEEVNKDVTSDGNTSSEDNYESKSKETHSGDDKLKKDYHSNVDDNGGGSNTNNRTDNLRHTDDTDQDEENKTSAYNENLYQPDDNRRTHTENTGTNTGTVKNDGNYSQNNERTYSGYDMDTTTHGHVIEKAITGDKNTGFNTNHEQEVTSIGSADERNTTTKDVGNRKAIGSTGFYAKQDFIKKERDLAKFNLYEWIAAKYKKDNMYRIYY